MIGDEMKSSPPWLKFLFGSMNIYLIIVTVVGMVILMNIRLNAELGMFERLQPLWVVFTFLLCGNVAQLSSDIRRFRKQNKEKKQAEEE